eukprot:1488178-Amphidinium_carterae.1
MNLGAQIIEERLWLRPGRAVSAAHLPQMISQIPPVQQPNDVAHVYVPLLLPSAGHGTSLRGPQSLPLAPVSVEASS